MSIFPYLSLCNAMVSLMKPLVEIAVHDLETNKIFYINGHLSKRKKGEKSHISKEEIEENLEKIVYEKINFDGRLIKSISLKIENKWLICINCDVSVFNHMKNLSAELLSNDSMDKPKSLFNNDWQEKVHVAIHDFIQKNGWYFNKLLNHNKKEIIKYLFDSGAFYEKNAADYVSSVLKIGRATVFNYLKEWRK
jgi:predicted transcriptional regulator YheO